MYKQWGDGLILIIMHMQFQYNAVSAIAFGPQNWQDNTPRATYLLQGVLVLDRQL